MTRELLEPLLTGQYVFGFEEKWIRRGVPDMAALHGRAFCPLGIDGLFTRRIADPVAPVPLLSRPPSRPKFPLSMSGKWLNIQEIGSTPTAVYWVHLPSARDPFRSPTGEDLCYDSV